jgi:hypothetical protein
MPSWRSALGDGVNLASRLEGLCKQYDVGILASEAVEQRAREAFVFRLVDAVAVKGKTKSVRVYELLGPKGESVLLLHVAQTYERAFNAYTRREFAVALALSKLNTRTVRALSLRNAVCAIAPTPRRPIGTAASMLTINNDKPSTQRNSMALAA